jgi:hypothetical protein
MWFILAIGLWLYVRLGGATRGKWRILDGKVESVLMSDLELQGGSTHLCRLGPVATSIDYVLAHTGFMRSHKLSSFDGR